MLYFIPETTNKTVMEIMEDFNKLNYKNRKSDTEKANFGFVTKFWKCVSFKTLKAHITHRLISNLNNFIIELLVLNWSYNWI